MRQVFLQCATAFFVTKYDGLLLQSATAFSLQSATSVITTCESVTILLQGATGITKCDDYYKVRQNNHEMRGKLSALNFKARQKMSTL